jgi:uroporphyrinogen III methyltransferase / synthase
MSEETPGRLQGLRIAVTREQAGELAGLLADAGAEVVHCPLIRVAPATGGELAAALARTYDWVVFTSSNALRFTMQAGVPRCANVACVGGSTADEARAHGLSVTLVPVRGHVKGLIEAFAALGLSGGSVLYPRSELAASTLKEGLQALGFTVDDPVAYRTLPDTAGMASLAGQTDLQAIVLASPSAVACAANAIGDRLGRLRIYSIGPTTSRAVREAGFQLTGEAAEHSTAGLVAVIIEKESRA